jgi:hypothetical protein
VPVLALAIASNQPSRPTLNAPYLPISPNHPMQGGPRMSAQRINNEEGDVLSAEETGTRNWSQAAAVNGYKDANVSPHLHRPLVDPEAL